MSGLSLTKNYSAAKARQQSGKPLTRKQKAMHAQLRVNMLKEQLAEAEAQQQAAEAELRAQPHPWLKLAKPAPVVQTAGEEWIGAEVVNESPRESMRRANAHAIRSEVFRHRIDWHWLTDGRIEAILTITLPDGHEFRFTAAEDPKELAALLAARNPAVGGFLGDMWKGVKKIAKTVATSKVFKLAGTALAVAAPALGPLAPAALAAGASMKAATALIAARHHEAKGNKEGAAKLVAYAAKASKVAATVAPPKATKKAAAPAQAAHQAHADAATQSSGKLYQLLLRPV